jgi:putative CocE/NonD family hydrolase
VKALSLATILFIAVFAGCLAGKDQPPSGGPAQKKKAMHAVDPSVYLPKLSPILYEKILRENIKVASFDGKRMDAWLYRPEVPEGTKVPVFINFSPYWSNLEPAAGAEGDAFGRYMIHEYVPRGYAVVLTSVRGTGYSEGCFNIGGEVERKDAVAVIDFFAKQPWSNGNVAAGGKSYDGTTPQGAAIMGDPNLKAIFPVEPITELYQYNYKGGIPYGNGASFNAYYYAGESAAPKDAQGPPPLFMADRVACPTLPDTQSNGVGSAASGDSNAYWQERNYTKGASKVTAALFFVEGFTDWNVKPDNILPWLNMIPAPKKVYLHNWTKNWKPNGDGHVYPMRDDWNVTMLRFLDQTLKGIDTGIFTEPNYQIQDSSGAWRWEETWPPASAVATRFYFAHAAGKGELALVAPKSSTTATFLDAAPAGATVRGGTSCKWTEDQTIVKYETPVLDHEVHYAGAPIVHMQARSDKAVGKVIAPRSTSGPTGEFEMINWGGLNLRHRVSLDNPQTVVPGALYDLNFPLFPQDDVVPSGWKLVLFLAGGYGGQYAAAPYGDQLTVLENDKAYVELPLEGGALAYETPQPTLIHCFAC